ncbi:MAG: hypothetical protein FWE40_02815 [Oscillospiraceae bacterium]|nr:hypothetical protein [Oscillospiraceae bacterium]
MNFDNIDFDQISSMLGSMSDDDLQNLQDAAQSLFASYGQTGGESMHQQEDSHDTFDSGQHSAGNMFTPEMLARLSAMMQRMHTRDPRTDLIMALKPHLSRQRQQRADQAAQMMKMFALLPELQHVMK